MSKLWQTSEPTTPTSTESNERRLRAPLMVVRAGAREDPKTLFGYATHLGREGLTINSLAPKDVGSLFRLELAAPGPRSRTLECTCEVVWQRFYTKDQAYKPGMGLKFLDLPDEASVAIDAWIREQSLEEELQ